MSEELYVRLRQKGHFVWAQFKKNFEDAVKQVRTTLSIPDNIDIRFKDKDGAVIPNNFLIQFLNISGCGAILKIEQENVDIISLDVASSSASTVTLEVDQANSPLSESSFNISINTENADEPALPSTPIQIEASCSKSVTTIKDRYNFPDFDLKTLLETTPLGNSILNHYNTHYLLDNRRRTRLVDIIVKHIYNYLVKNRLKHHEYNILTAKIISLFPTENPLTYYVPAVKKCQNSKKKHIPAKGKLTDKCKNLLYIGEDWRRKKENKNISEGDPLLLDTDEVQDAITWLKVRCEPWSEVYEKWKLTYPARKRDGSLNVSDYLKNWPILLDKELSKKVLFYCYGYDTISFQSHYKAYAVKLGNKPLLVSFENIRSIYPTIEHVLSSQIVVALPKYKP